MSEPISRDDSVHLTNGVNGVREQQETDIQAAWQSWDPATPMPDILMQGGEQNQRSHSGWDPEEAAQIERNLRVWREEGRTGAVDSAGGDHPIVDTYDRDERYGELPEDDEFPDALEDRGYLEYVLFQRGCAERRRQQGLAPLSCNRTTPCVDCQQHEGSSTPMAYWQFIGDEALEVHVGNYLTTRSSLPPWQPTCPSNLHAPQIVFGRAPAQDAPTNANGAPSSPPTFGPAPPLPFDDTLEDVRIA